ncbi:unnamed protein product [Lactuca saligna]|uniref:Uncharacterized protein n=1 Tax=Lactuca saligna TaxID=75948 RepID=A0AA36ECP3_LACSI|nr:unnamed protein product [Lactuca saligna]
MLAYDAFELIFVKTSSNACSTDLVSTKSIMGFLGLPAWSKCSFQLTSYLADDIPPKSIVVEDVVLDQNMDRMTSMPESPIALLGFGPNAFSINQLLDISCPVISFIQVGSFSSAGVIPSGSVSSSRKHRRVLSPDQFEQFL